MSKLPIKAKIWPSVSIFLVGFAATTAMVQVQGIERERSIRSNLDFLFPAAQAAKDAEAYFLSSQRQSNDAFVTQDPAALERAAADDTLASLQHP